MDHKTINTRIMNILIRLIDGEELFTAQLAKEYGVSQRTIQRDFSERINLSNIRYNQHNQSWLFDNSEYKVLNKEEILTINMLMQISKSYGIYDKVKTLFDKYVTHKSDAIYTKVDSERFDDQSELAYQIEEAITTDQAIMISYSDKERVVSPYKLANLNGYWYLVAYEHSSDKIKTYYFKEVIYLNNVEDEYQLITDDLKRTLDLALNAYFKAHLEPFEVQLLISHEAKKYFIRKPISISQRVIRENSDGTIEIALDITDNNELIPTILQWIPHVDVIYPQSLADDIQARIKEYIKH